MSKYLILLSLVFSAVSFASEKVASAAEETMVDVVHENLSTGLTKLSNRIDRFFGSKRAIDQANGTYVRMTYLTTKTESDDLNHEGFIKFHLKLPYLEELLKVSFKREPIKEEADNEGKVGPADSENSAKKLGGAILSETKKWSFHVNTGIKVEIPPQFFANLRLSRSATFGEWDFRAAQEFFWFSRDGFGETSTIDFDRPIDVGLLFRFRNVATWTDEADEFNTEHGPILFWQLSDRRAVSFAAAAIGISKPSFHINSYRGSINYRQLLYKRWFYLDTGPSIEFPRSARWHSILSYSLKFEVLIGTY